MSENRFPEEVASWVALRTAARWEKKIAAMLQNCEVAIFLPTLTRVIQYSSKRRSSEIPLFSGYVFCSEPDFIGNSRIPLAWRTPIAQVLKPTDPEQLRRELTRVAQLLQSHQIIQERIYGRRGDTVRIKAGSFAGQEGVITGMKPNKRMLVLEISFLHCKIEIEIEEHLVEKA